tara:strand:+ start:1321 stop:1752 length:432 start_codon:yes stop_codon:yes gene_type:complete
MNGAAMAQQEPYGEDFWYWKFTQETVANNVVVCRATRTDYDGSKVVITQGSNGNHYIGITKPANVNGTYPNAQLNLADGPMTVRAFTKDSWLYFGPLDDWSLDTIVQQQGFVWVVGNASDETDLMMTAPIALNRVIECIQANS